MAQQIQIRRGTAAAAAATDPVLAEGEQGWEKDTGVVKIGDGVTVWSALPVAFTVGVDADDQTAADVPFAPAGSIEATDVQAAIVELDTDLIAEGESRADADAALDGRVGAIEGDYVQSADLATKADLVGGVVPTAQMPAITIMERVPVADEAARLALTSPGDVQVGDVAVQADTGTTWLLVDADPSLAGSWKAIDQSDAVSSVNGQTGTVVLGKADVGLGTVDNTADLAKPISTAAQTALDAKANVDSPALSGTPTAPTPAVSTDTTQIATTAFVKGAVDNATSQLVTLVRKAASESVVSLTALQNDAHLVVAVEANKTFTFRGLIGYEAGTTGDLKLGFTIPAGASILWTSGGIRGTDTSSLGGFDGAVVDAGGATKGHGGAGVGVKLALTVSGILVVGGTAGNLQLQWAQQTTEAVSTTLYANSYLEVRQAA